MRSIKGIIWSWRRVRSPISLEPRGPRSTPFPLYSLNDAERLRSRILKVFEDADANPALVEQGALNFVIVGAGPTGTEMAGTLTEMINTTLSTA